ncbi:Ima1 N-terminal domain-containing protein [Mariannaea sp. PMI_226]|nr:Ima1 N-terminal domain-containing protein [Mariannaea sp. PMI_226]
MPRLQRTRYLSCFYCGKRSNTKFDGVIRNFLCLYCDATNYLDENGDITDPPVATEREAPATQYASQRATSPPASQDDTFCATCLKNQRLFTTSLAQYLPGDPSDPEYPVLERNYYRFRKNLEERYPQVCVECAERVESRIRQAGYTAKTDHLRRMVEKSRGRRTEGGRTTGLDWVNDVGRGLWWGGLVLQMLWHLRLVSKALKHTDEGMYDPDDQSWHLLAISGLAWVVTFLPPADTLITGAFVTSVLSVWWNPKFVQVTRGFTRHLLGFTQWYSFQGLIIFFRFMFPRILVMQGNRGEQSRAGQLSAHLAMAVFMNVIYTLARGSIRVDTTPLFGTHAPVSPKPTTATPPRPLTRKEELMTFSDQLTEALDSTVAAPELKPSPSAVNAFQQPFMPYSNDNNDSAQIRDSPSSARMANLGLGSAGQVQYSDEMDWQPTVTQVPRRPFGEASQSWSKQRFGETPVNHDNPFWYKVPAAPMNPAQRLRNPPMPVLTQNPVQREGAFFPRSIEPPKKTQAKKEEEEDGVEFKQPSFFAVPQQLGNNTDDSLASLVNRSFKLREEEESEARNTRKNSGMTKRFGRSRPTTPRTPQNPLAEREIGVEFVIIACLLAFWLLTVAFSIPFGRELRLALLAGAGTIALRVTGNSADSAGGDGTGPSRADYIGSALSVVELAAVCWLSWEVWENDVDTGKYGTGVLLSMLAHQVWNTTQ